MQLFLYQDCLTLLKVIFDPSCNTDQGVLELRECSGSTKPTTRSESEKWKELFFYTVAFIISSLFFAIFLGHKEKKKGEGNDSFRRWASNGSFLVGVFSFFFLFWCVKWPSCLIFFLIITGAGIPLQHPPIWTFIWEGRGGFIFLFSPKWSERIAGRAQVQVPER